MHEPQHNQLYDVLIIGSGAAGLTLALRLPEALSVALLCKDALGDGSTRYAQGGISAVLGNDDSLETHIQDTLIAGAGLSDPAAVTHTVENGPAAVRWLIDLGVPFTPAAEDNKEGFPFHLTREGGHSKRRIIHADDHTGAAVGTTLEQQVQQRPNTAVLEHCLALKLLKHNQRAAGAYVLNTQTQRTAALRARFVVLATGGANKAYLYSTNPHSSSGDGIAMAWRAGCRVANMEFMQFHPTCLYHAKDKNFLLTEAIRGEGGVLRLPNGQRFMSEHDKRAELAPRDIVARAIDYEMKKHGVEHVYLDISHKPADFIQQHFPNIYSRCLSLGYDMTREGLPTVPAAHYTCGGVITDKHGSTDVEGLYAIGETAFTGLHGANRMASNSLLECLVYAMSAAEHIHASQAAAPPEFPSWDDSRVATSNEAVVVKHNWRELRETMWNYVGVVRSDKRLERAMTRLETLSEEVEDYYRHYRIDANLIELRNLALVAKLIVRSAQQRKESRGLHYTLDYPDLIDEAKNTVLAP